MAMKFSNIDLNYNLLCSFPRQLGAQNSFIVTKFVPASVIILCFILLYNIILCTY